MGNCSRCMVQSLIKKYGDKNIIEVVHKLGPLTGWTSYDIMVRLQPGEDPRVTKSKVVTYQGIQYRFAMGVFSDEHSLDEDCMFGYARGFDPKQYGFPTTRIKIEDLDKP